MTHIVSKFKFMNYDFISIYEYFFMVIIQSALLLNSIVLLNHLYKTMNPGTMLRCNLHQSLLVESKKWCSFEIKYLVIQYSLIIKISR